VKPATEETTSTPTTEKVEEVKVDGDGSFMDQFQVVDEVQED